MNGGVTESDVRGSDVHHFPSAVIKPWVGHEFTNGLNGLRLLIVTNARHETSDPDQFGALTIRLVERAIRGEGTDLSDGEQIANAVSGRALGTRAERVAFWQSVALVNATQRQMGDPDDSVTEDGAAASRAVLVDVLTSLRPHAAIFTGFRLWQRLALLDHQGVLRPKHRSRFGPWGNGTELWEGMSYPPTIVTATLDPGALTERERRLYARPYWQTQLSYFLAQAKEWASRQTGPVTSSRNCDSSQR